MDMQFADNRSIAQWIQVLEDHTKNISTFFLYINLKLRLQAKEIFFFWELEQKDFETREKKKKHLATSLRNLGNADVYRTSQAEMRRWMTWPPTGTGNAVQQQDNWAMTQTLWNGY